MNLVPDAGHAAPKPDADPADPIARPTQRGADKVVHPPRPRLVARIGMTGHLPGRLERAARQRESTYDALAAELRKAFRDVANEVSASLLALHAEEARFFSDERPLVRLVASGALGADRIAVDLVHEEFRNDEAVEWEIDMILPASRQEFMLDAALEYHRAHRDEPFDQRSARMEGRWAEAFSRAQTVVELPQAWRRLVDQPSSAVAAAEAPDAEEAAIRDQARADAEAAVARFPDRTPCPFPGYVLDHVAAAEFLLRQVDLLIAVWDGKPAQGPGGTPDIAAQALEQGLPVVHLNPLDKTIVPHMLKGVQREKRPPNIRDWYARPLRPEPRTEDATSGGLRDALRAVLAPPSPTADDDRHDRRGERRKLEDFLAEDWPTRPGPRLYDAFCALFRGELAALGALLRPRRRLEEPHATDAEWTTFIRERPDEGEQGARLKQVLHRRYVVARLLAERYADEYRHVYVGMYLRAAAAVLAALAGLVLPEAAWAPFAKPVLLLVEIWLLFGIYRLQRGGERRHLHNRFIEYRALAEALRVMRVMATFAEHTPIGLDGASRSDWRGWYLAATERELGLPQGELGPDYQGSLLRLLDARDLAPLALEHERTQDHNAEVEHGLHRFGSWLFFLILPPLCVMAVLATVAAIPGAFEGKPVLAEWLKAAKPWIGLAAAGLPAIGAALLAIRFTADFDGEAARARAMIAEIEAQRRAIQAALGAEEFEATRAALLGTARLQAKDMAAFMAIFGRKRLTLPS